MRTLSAKEWGQVLTLAFTLWNHTLKTFSATESSILNSLMLVQIPMLAYFFLGEAVSAGKIVGLACAGVGILVVQVR